MSRKHRERLAEQKISEIEAKLKELKDEQRDLIIVKDNAEARLEEIDEEIVELESQLNTYNDVISY